LRGVSGSHPGVRVLEAFLARYPLSMRKPCLESYILEEQLNKLTLSYFLKTQY